MPHVMPIINYYKIKLVRIKIMIDKAFIDTHLEGLKECVKDASNAILEVYESSDFGEINKQDGSPLTIADKNAGKPFIKACENPKCFLL